jgi:hypothetical protein
MVKYKKNNFLLVISSCMFFLLNFTTVQAFENSVDDIEKAIVKIKDTNGTGFVFHISNKNVAYIMTAHHVVEDYDLNNQFEVEIPGRSNPYTAMVEWAYQEIDLAILKIIEKCPADQKQLTLGNSDDIIRGDNVYIYGYPGGRGLTRDNGSVSTKDKNKIILDDITPDKGYSGGPLLHDKTNEVIGMIIQKSNDPTKQYAIKIDTIRTNTEAIAEIWPFIWQKYLDKMSERYTECLGKYNDETLNQSEKLECWKQFLAEYKDDNPNSIEDQLMRDNAKSKVSILNKEVKILSKFNDDKRLEIALLEETLAKIKKDIEVRNDSSAPATPADSLKKMLQASKENKKQKDLLGRLTSDFADKRDDLVKKKEEERIKELQQKIDMYEEIVSLDPDKGTMEKAWNLLVSSLPEASDLEIDYIIGFKHLAGMPSLYRDTSQTTVDFPLYVKIHKETEYGFSLYSTIEHDYEIMNKGDDIVVIDHTTGLMWHQSGSENYTTRKEVRSWIRNLNRNGYAGYSDWRLATIEESISLLEPSVIEGSSLYINQIFDQEQSSTWIGDFCGIDCQWAVDFDSGKLSRYNSDSGPPSHIRPVRYSTGDRKMHDWNTYEDRGPIKLRSRYEDLSSAQLHHTYIKHDFIKKDKVLIDNATGLMWHRSGSKYDKRTDDDFRKIADELNAENKEIRSSFSDSRYLDADDFISDHDWRGVQRTLTSLDEKQWNEAKDWVDDLNENLYAGYTDWRMPTIEELGSVLFLFGKDKFFGKERSLWTGDSCGNNKAWAYLFYWSKFECKPVDYEGCYVLPVRSLK